MKIVYIDAANQRVNDEKLMPIDASDATDAHQLMSMRGVGIAMQWMH